MTPGPETQEETAVDAEQPNRPTTRYQANDIIRKAITAGIITVDWGGHYKTGDGKQPGHRYDPDFYREKLSIAFYMGVAEADAVDIAVAFQEGMPLNAPVAVGPQYLQDCWECGQELTVLTDGLNWRVEQPCPHPHGIGPVEFELNVPSGVLVVANDLREQFPVLGEYNVNENHGIAQTVRAYAKAGLAHGFVGNTCPAFVANTRQGEEKASRFVIGVRSSRGSLPRESAGDKARRVGGVTTDLWWFSVCDRDELAPRLGQSVEVWNDANYGAADLVPCRPGVYRCRYLYHTIEDRDSRKNPQVYATFEWVRRPDPLADYFAGWNGLNLSAEQVMAAKLARWPDLYAFKSNLGGGRTPLSADLQYQKTAGHLLLTVGGGDSYHPNGFWCGVPDIGNDAPAVEPVNLDKTYHWSYGSRTYSALACIAGLSKDFGVNRRVNKSFVALAFNVARCILVNGVAFHMEQFRRHAEETFALAWDAMTGLKAHYPDQVPENCLDIRETDRPVMIKPYS